MTWTQVPSPNRYDVRDRPLDLVVLHYTAGRGNAMSVAALFALPKRKASAHFVVGRAGEIVQCVDLEDAAWHAGDGRFPSASQLDQPLVPAKSVPKKPRDLNMRSIGIEICNAGWSDIGTNPYVAARHRNPASRRKSWESYSGKQLDAVQHLVCWLAQEHPSLRWVTGHEDVTHRYTLGKPGAKLDPGPLFPWNIATERLERVMFDFPKQGWRVV